MAGKARLRVSFAELVRCLRLPDDTKILTVRQNILDKMHESVTLVVEHDQIKYGCEGYDVPPFIAPTSTLDVVTGGTIFDWGQG